jgi:hypothetical protein
MSEISIEDDIEKSILKRIERTHFETLEEYVNFVLKEVLDSDTHNGDEESRQEQDLEEQLEDLGYL